MNNEENFEKSDDKTKVTSEDLQDQKSDEVNKKKSKTHELKKELDDLNKKLFETESKMQEYLFSAQRLQADFDNYRKRNVEIYKTSKEEGITETIKNILPVLDNLKRAELSEHSDGVTQIIKQFNDILKKMGVVSIDVKQDDDFNPDFHYAVMQDDSGNFKPGKIAEVLQDGYMFENGKIIRFSMVKVAI